MAVINEELSTSLQPTGTGGSELRLSPPSWIVVWLSTLVAALATIATSIGIFSQGGPGQFAFKTVRGETVTMLGQGTYRFDTLFQGAIDRGTDIVTLVIGIPLHRIIVMPVPGIIAGTFSRLPAGAALSAGEIVGPVARFVILGLIAIWLQATLLGRIGEEPGTARRTGWTSHEPHSGWNGL